MDLTMLLSVIGTVASTGVCGWALKLYGTQREQAGKLEVLETAWATSRTDHDAVVKLESDFHHVTEQLQELKAELKSGMDRVIRKLEERP